ncbi:CARDB domain-containing protein, partial [Chloroflexota bacterium]
MVNKILATIIVLSLFFIPKLAGGDKVNSYSYAANYIDNTRLTSASFLTLAPDLIIEAITLLPENPSKGDAVTFTVTIKNQGSGKADSSHVAYYIDDAYLTLDSVGSIDTGASATKTFTWTAQAGSHAIKAVADSNNEVAEGDETNNVRTYSFSILAPDLIIEAITWTPENPSKGDTVTFSVTIRNQGNDRAVSSRVYLYIDGLARNDQAVLGIDAGATATKTFSWFAKAGSHVIKAVADSSNNVSESDETNNEMAVNFSTLAPDLIIEAITMLPENPSKGDAITFTVTIKNQGSGRSYYSNVAFYIDDAYLTSGHVDLIDVSASANVTFNWTAQAGSHVIKAVADPNDSLIESDETNNEMAVT